MSEKPVAADAEAVVVKVDEEKPPFVPSKGLTSAEAEALLKQWGKNELESKRTPSWVVYLNQLRGLMPIMIWVAIIIEAGIQNWIDFGILIALQFINATIGWYETVKAGDAVAALKASLKPVATVKRDGKTQNIDATMVVPGDLVLLAAGSAVPADCIVNSGRIEVDQAALTGESLPVTMRTGDDVRMGSTVTRGEEEGTVVATGKHTFFGKTAALIQGTDGMGNLDKIILRVMVVLLVLSISMVTTAFIYLLTESISFRRSLSFAVVVLVASIPIAVEIVLTTTLALGSRQLSSHGAIVTRLASIEEMAGMNMLCSDKTGTLTMNKMVIQEDTPVFKQGETQYSILQAAALAAKWKEPPRDALDTLVLGSADLPALDKYEQIDFLPFDPTVKRTAGTLRGPDGKVFKTTKGAPHVILDLCHNKDEIQAGVWGTVDRLGKRGIRSLAVARADEEDKFEMLGMLTFLDPPREDTKYTIERALEYGVDVKMITGDHKLIAQETARQLGMGDNILGSEGLPLLGPDGKAPKDLGKKYGKLILETDGFAQVFPEHKYLIVEALRQEGFAVGMTGDGVNDAPALKRADIGVAVEGSTDAARAAADIVLTQPGLSVVVEAIVIARQIFQRMKSFLQYRIAATLQLLFFFFIAVFAFKPEEYVPGTGRPDGFCDDPNSICWPEFFRLPVLMLMLITILNDGTLITIGHDNVRPSPRPEKWNLKVVFLVSSVLALVACLSSLLLLAAALDSCEEDGQSNNSGSVFDKFGLPCIEYGKIITMIYLKVSISDFLTLFSARTNGFFWTQRPSNYLLVGAVTALTISTILATTWPEWEEDDVPVLGLAREPEDEPERPGGTHQLWTIWIWIYCFIVWIIQDTLKVLTIWAVEKYDLFGNNTAKLINVRAATAVDDPKYSLARSSVAVVETKLAVRKLENATAHVEELARNSGPSSALARVSAHISIARTSIGLAGEGKRGSIEIEAAKLGEVEKQLTGIEEVVETIEDAEQRGEVQKNLSELRKAADNLARVSQAFPAIKRKSAEK